MRTSLTITHLNGIQRADHTKTPLTLADGSGYDSRISEKRRLLRESTAHFLPPAGQRAGHPTGYPPAPGRKQCPGYAGTTTGSPTDATSPWSEARRETVPGCAISSPPINRTIGCRAVITACTGTFGFFCWASIIAGLVRSAMDRAAVEDHAVDVTLVQPAVELLFRFPWRKLWMMNSTP